VNNSVRILQTTQISGCFVSWVCRECTRSGKI